MTTRILIVDDHAELRKLVRMTLDGDAYELHEAANGDQALEMIESLQPRVVILDVMMPGSLDGYEVCERVKREARLKDTTVILLTARGQKSDLERGTEVRADGYLVKPFSPLELMDAVDRAASVAA
jgi:CheY-like chemotaxis protein